MPPRIMPPFIMAPMSPSTTVTRVPGSDAGRQAADVCPGTPGAAAGWPEETATAIAVTDPAASATAASALSRKTRVRTAELLSGMAANRRHQLAGLPADGTRLDRRADDEPDDHAREDQHHESHPEPVTPAPSMIPAHHGNAPPRVRYPPFTA